jgi:hypothetical protein
MVNLFCCRNWDEVRNNKVLDVAAKVLLVRVPNVAAQPRSASEHQIWFHGDMFGGNEFEQSANRLERFTRPIAAKISLRFPRADHPQATLSGFDLDGDGADIRDSADVPALLAPLSPMWNSIFF